MGARTRSGRRRVRSRLGAAVMSVVASAATVVCADVSVPASAAAAHPTTAVGPAGQRPRTVITTDMEQDDYDSLIRYLLYSDEFDTQGIVYSASVYHWAGDGKGTPFLSPNPRREYDTPQTSWRWTGDTIIQGLLGQYARVYRNLRAHDPGYPSPQELLSRTKLGNVDFEGEMSHDTAGSDLIKKLLLDNDPRPLYLQAWGGTNTIARALRSIHDQYAGTPQWQRVQDKVSAKAVIVASGFQDLTYTGYIAPNWPKLQVRDVSGGYGAWGYYFEGHSPVPPQWQYYFGADWTKKNILDVGPLGAQYFVWGDGRSTPGDPLDTFGDLNNPPKWLPARKKYDFLSEGDTVAFMNLIDTGLRSEPDPTWGGWGGRLVRQTATPNLWTSAPSDLGPDGTAIGSYGWTRWIPAAQNDFATRLKWSVTPPGQAVDHQPVVRALTGDASVRAGTTVTACGLAYDPDGGPVGLRWSQYQDAGTFPGAVTITGADRRCARAAIPAGARSGQTIHLVLTATDGGDTALTHYARVVLTVR
ncbi:DUF1593 domain-containing protein [Actinoallomurus iriomotensis]|uniref:DUF1593 domain-containing protein n=1 Tax=Actinoallomurus iriomotensis TaxID=478107 RepID=UPI002555313D|nr:nucleoside hydrolase-like domain-containing protein [Actinoallomurus iriomotensis]